SRNSFEYFDGRGMKQVSLPVKPVSIKPGTIHLVVFEHRAYNQDDVLVCTLKRTGLMHETAALG
ncbi:hypothetical protein JOC45_004271, partial [Gordonia hydrophobica]|nr:hypothetical protein [Gordonia hydrophobica]